MSARDKRLARRDRVSALLDIVAASGKGTSVILPGQSRKLGELPVGTTFTMPDKRWSAVVVLRGASSTTIHMTEGTAPFSGTTGYISSQTNVVTR